MQSSLIVANNFYSNPLVVREKGLDYFRRGEQDIIPISSRTIHKLEQLVGTRITKIHNSDKNYPNNGAFFHQKKSDGFVLKVHHDFGAHQYIALVYLTPDAPADAGTSFWQHKKTSIRTVVTPSDAERLEKNMDELHDMLEQDAPYRHRWKEIDRVGNQFNRIVLFNACYLHSATRVFGKNLETGRLTQYFNFSTL
ncbi:MAG: hypothetical protein RL557_758 [archaeon]|jgi:hypothetical protein